MSGQPDAPFPVVFLGQIQKGGSHAGRVLLKGKVSWQLALIKTSVGWRDIREGRVGEDHRGCGGGRTIPGIGGHLYPTLLL